MSASGGRQFLSLDGAVSVDWGALFRRLGKGMVQAVILGVLGVYLRVLEVLESLFTTVSLAVQSGVGAVTAPGPVRQAFTQTAALIPDGPLGFVVGLLAAFGVVFTLARVSDGVI